MRLTKLMPKKALLLNTELTRFIQNSPVLNPVLNPVLQPVLKKGKQVTVGNSAKLLSIAHRIMPSKMENYFVLHQVKRIIDPCSSMN